MHTVATLVLQRQVVLLFISLILLYENYRFGYSIFGKWQCVMLSIMVLSPFVLAGYALSSWLVATRSTTLDNFKHNPYGYALVIVANALNVAAMAFK